MKMVFSNISNVEDGLVRDIVSEAVSLTKAAMVKYFSATGFVTDRTAKVDNYDESNKIVREGLLKYSLQQAGLGEDYLETNKFKLVAATNDGFAWHTFAVISEILNTVNSKVEIEDALMVATVRNLAEGDSANFELGTKSLYKVEDVGYSNNTSKIQYTFRDNVQMVPRRKQAEVGFDLYQLNTSNYDFGEEMARLAVSFRAKMYKEVIDAIYDTAAVNGTPFYKATFSATNVIELAERIGAVNGAKAMAFGTKLALNAASTTVDTKWTFQSTGEYVKSGVIGDMYGVPTMMIDQAIDPSSSAYTFQVPNDRLVVISAGVDKPVKVVMEGQTYMLPDDGKTNAIGLRTYQVTQSWVTEIVTDAVYGIITVA